jgi:hypothetical protein
MLLCSHRVAKVSGTEFPGAERACLLSSSGEADTNFDGEQERFATLPQGGLYEEPLVSFNALQIFARGF